MRRKKKSVMLALVLWLFIAASVNGQVLVGNNSAGSRDNKEQAIMLLCHKWNINSNTAGAVSGCFPADSISTIDFYGDGRVFFNAKRKIEGAWNCDNSGRELYITINGHRWKYKILSLTENQLVLESVANKKPARAYLWRAAQ